MVNSSGLAQRSGYSGLSGHYTSFGMSLFDLPRLRAGDRRLGGSLSYLSKRRYKGTKNFRLGQLFCFANGIVLPRAQIIARIGAQFLYFIAVQPSPMADIRPQLRVFACPSVKQDIQPTHADLRTEHLVQPLGDLNLTDVLHHRLP